MENTLKLHVASVGTETEEAPEILAAEKSFTMNRFANLWLLTLGFVIALTLLCTGVLVAWPLLAHIASKLG